MVTQRAALYARVSQARQSGAEHFSLPSQREMFLARCAAKGFEVGPEYVDTETGRTATRAGYQALIKDAKAHAFDVVVVRAIDRLGRDANELTVRVSELAQAGVTVDAISTIVPEAGADPSTTFLLRAVEAFLAQKESEQIAARVRSTMAVAARGGGVTGVPPYGYRVENKRYVVDPFEAEVVRGIFKSYTEENRSQLQIAHDLNARDVPSARKRPWTPTTVGQVLRRRGYTGDVEWGGETTKGARPAIIDAATFEAARARAAVKRTLPAGRTQTSSYLLSGLVWCARCGGRMIGHRSQDGRTTHRGYVCSEHRKHGKCSLNWHRADVLEGAVLDAITAIGKDTQEAHQRAQDEAGRLEGLLAGVEAALSGIPARFERDLDRFNRGVYGNEEQYRLANQVLIEEQKRLEGERERLRDEIARARLAADHVETMHRIRTASDTAASMSLAERKAALQQVIARVDCDAREAPRVTLRY